MFLPISIVHGTNVYLVFHFLVRLQINFKFKVQLISGLVCCPYFQHNVMPSYFISMTKVLCKCWNSIHCSQVSSENSLLPNNFFFLKICCSCSYNILQGGSKFSVLTDTSTLWPYNVVYYEFDSSLREFVSLFFNLLNNHFLVIGPRIIVDSIRHRVCFGCIEE